MSILLSIFIISFLSLAIMFSRKLVVLKNQGITEAVEGHFPLEVPFIKEIKHITVKKVKRYGYLGLVATIRYYFRSTNSMKVKYRELETKARSLRKTPNPIEKKEVSGFLKVVSTYKDKIRTIKHQIEEEEKVL